MAAETVDPNIGKVAHIKEQEVKVKVKGNGLLANEAEECAAKDVTAGNSEKNTIQDDVEENLTKNEEIEISGEETSTENEKVGDSSKEPAAVKEDNRRDAQDIWDMTKEKDYVTKEKDDVTEEKDNVIEGKDNITSEKANVTREKANITVEKDGFEEKDNVTKEMGSVTGKEDNINVEKDNITGEKDLSDKKDNVTEEKGDVTGKEDNVTVENDNVTELTENVTEEGDCVCGEKDDVIKDMDIVEERDTNEEYYIVARVQDTTMEEHDTTEESNIIGNENMSIDKYDKPSEDYDEETVDKVDVKKDKVGDIENKLVSEAKETSEEKTEDVRMNLASDNKDGQTGAIWAASCESVESDVLKEACQEEIHKDKKPMASDKKDNQIGDISTDYVCAASCESVQSDVLKEASQEKIEKDKIDLASDKKDSQTGDICTEHMCIDACECEKSDVDTKSDKDSKSDVDAKSDEDTKSKSYASGLCTEQTSAKPEVHTNCPQSDGLFNTQSHKTQADVIIKPDKCLLAHSTEAGEILTDETGGVMDQNYGMPPEGVATGVLTEGVTVVALVSAPVTPVCAPISAPVHTHCAAMHDGIVDDAAKDCGIDHAAKDDGTCSADDISIDCKEDFAEMKNCVKSSEIMKEEKSQLDENEKEDCVDLDIMNKNTEDTETERKKKTTECVNITNENVDIKRKKDNTQCLETNEDESKEKEDLEKDTSRNSDTDTEVVKGPCSSINISNSIDSSDTNMTSLRQTERIKEETEDKVKKIPNMDDNGCHDDMNVMKRKEAQKEQEQALKTNRIADEDFNMEGDSRLVRNNQGGENVSQIKETLDEEKERLSYIR